MDTLAVEQAMRQCWNESWPEVAAELSEDVSLFQSLRVMGRLTGLLQKIVLCGFREWLERGDCPDDVIVREGLMRRFKCVSEHQFLTPCGEVTVTRRLYQADRGGPTFCPLDEAWGMVGEYATPEVREAASFVMALVPAGEAEQVFHKAALFHPSSTTLKKLAADTGRWLEAHESTVADVRHEEDIPAETLVVAASLDGVNVRLDEPGPKPGRPVAGDDGTPAPTCFKNAMVGTVSLYGEIPTGEEAPQKLQTRYVGRMPEEGSPTFRRQFEEEVRDTLAHCLPAVARVLVMDAARHLWDYAESHPLFRDFEKIVDFHHAYEHLETAADALFGKGTDAAKAWLHRHSQTLLQHDDGPQRVIRALDRAAGKRKFSRSARAELDRQRQFFRNNADRMTYATFRRRGFPIGSGPVEAAAKTLVKVRLGRSGMFWSRTGGQHILSLRTLIKSDRWDAVWKRYLQSRQAA